MPEGFLLGVKVQFGSTSEGMVPLSSVLHVKLVVRLAAIALKVLSEVKSGCFYPKIFSAFGYLVL